MLSPTSSPLRFAGSLALLVAAPIASAAVIGVDDFSYPDGSVVGQAGGSGFDYDMVAGTHTGVTSTWESVFNDPQVSGGTLVTSDSGVQRKYNGADEANGALRGNGVVFYLFSMARSAAAAWGGASSYDFGAERIFFGIPGGGAGTDTIGIDESGVGTTLGSINLVDGQSYTMIAVLDFDNDLLGLFVDPDGNDFWNTADGSNSADVTRAYGGTNWSTSVRLASGGGVTWDNLTVATHPTEVGLAIPEASVGLLGGVAWLLLLRRRRP